MAASTTTLRNLSTHCCICSSPAKSDELNRGRPLGVKGLVREMAIFPMSEGTRIWELLSGSKRSSNGGLLRDRTIWGEYWRFGLGRHDGTTFLMECCPFPRSSRSSRLSIPPEWTEEKVWSLRRVALRRHLDMYPPRTVVAYGMLTKEKASELFGVQKWRKVPNVEHEVSVSSNGQTRLAHVGFFGQGHFSCNDIPRIVGALRGRQSRGLPNL